MGSRNDKRRNKRRVISYPGQDFAPRYQFVHEKRLFVLGGKTGKTGKDGQGRPGAWSWAADWTSSS